MSRQSLLTKNNLIRKTSGDVLVLFPLGHFFKLGWIIPRSKAQLARKLLENTQKWMIYWVMFNVFVILQLNSYFGIGKEMIGFGAISSLVGMLYPLVIIRPKKIYSRDIHGELQHNIDPFGEV